MSKHIGWELMLNENSKPKLVCNYCGFEVLVENMDEYKNEDEYGFPFSCPKCKTKMFTKWKG